MKLPKIYVYINKIFNIQSSYFNYTEESSVIALDIYFILFYNAIFTLSLYM